MYHKNLFILLISFSALTTFSFAKELPLANDKATLPVRHIIEKTGNQTFVNYEFPSYSLKKIKNNDTIFQLISIEGFTNQGEIGKPAIPVRNDMLHLAAGEVNIKVVDSDYIELENINYYPTQEAHRDDKKEENESFNYDSELYNNDSYYPNTLVELIDKQYQNNQAIGIIQLRPVQYNPVQKKLRIYTSIRYKVTYKSSSLRKRSLSSYYLNNQATGIIQQSVINTFQPPVPSLKSTQASPISKNKESEYLILTHTSFEAAATKLATWKKQLGISVEVITNENWNYESIKDSISTRYHSWTNKPSYFLLLGDHDGAYSVPGKWIQDPNQEEYFATDLYYACMDGETDYIPEMAHGRIPAKEPGEAMNMVNKIIHYESTPPTDANFYTDVLACSYFQDDDNNGMADRRFCHTSEEIRDYFITNFDFNVERIYTTNSTNPEYYDNTIYSNGAEINPELKISNGFNWNRNKNDILASINKGKVLVYHRDHGFENGTGWVQPHFNTAALDGIDSNLSAPPIVLSVNCYSGKYSFDECFAEKMFHKGAIAVIAPANYSYSGYNDAVTAGIIESGWPGAQLSPEFGSGGKGTISSVYNEGLGLGDILNIGLNKMIQEWNGSTTTNRYEYELFHLFGDPSMKIWTQQPENITVDFEDNLGCGDTYFTIKNASKDGLATLIGDNEIVGQIQLSEGSGTIHFNTPLTDKYKNLTLTISAINSIPFIDTLHIDTDCNIPPIADYNVTNKLGCVNSTFRFEEACYFNAEDIKWVFEPNTITYINGTSDSSRFIDVYFNSPGKYSLKLVATNTFGKDSLLKKDLITVKPLIAATTAIDDSVTVGSTVSISDLSDCSVKNRKWIITPSNGYRFLNNSNDTSTNPSIRFTNAGEYALKLVAENEYGTDSLTKTLQVNDYMIVGDSKLNNTGLPIEPYYNYSYSQSIFTKQLFNGAGELKGLSFYWNGNSTWSDSIKVYMGHTEKEEFTSPSDWLTISSSQLVYNGLLSVDNNEGWVSILFDKPFSYNGIGNICITMAETTKGYHSSSDDFYASYSDTKNRSLVFFSDTENPTFAPNIKGEPINSLPNIKFNFNNPLPMEFDTLLVSRIENTKLFSNLENQKLLQLKFVTKGHAYPISINEIVLDLSNSDSTKNITGAALFHATNNTISKAKFYSDAEISGKQLSIDKEIPLLPDTNYYWLSVDIDSAASPGNSINLKMDLLRIDDSVKNIDTTNYSYTIEKLASQWSWLFYLNEKSFDTDVTSEISDLLKAYPQNALINYLVYYDSKVDSLTGLYNVHKVTNANKGELHRLDFPVSNDDNINSAETWNNIWEYIQTNYPAESFGLSIKHNADYLDYLQNDSLKVACNFGELSVWNIAHALKSQNTELDIITLETALLNQVEVMYEFKDLTKNLIVSSDLNNQTYWNYTEPFKLLRSTPFITTDAIIDVICNSYNSYGGENITPVSMKDFKEIFLPAFDLITDLLIKNISGYNQAYHEVLEKVSSNQYTYQQRSFNTFVKQIALTNNLPIDLKIVSQAYSSSSILNPRFYSSESNTTIFLPRAYTKNSIYKAVYHNDTNYFSFSESKWYDFIDSLHSYPINELKLVNEKLEIATCSHTFYDNGGLTDDYLNNSKGILTIYPDSSNNLIELDIDTFAIENGWDYFEVYNGNTINAPIIGAYTGNTISDTIISTADDGSLTIRFYTDNAIPDFGWKITVGCKEKYSYEEPAIVYACEGDSVEIESRYYYSSHFVSDTSAIDNEGYIINNTRIQFLPVHSIINTDTLLCSYDEMLSETNENSSISMYEMKDTFCIQRNYNIVALPENKLNLMYDTILLDSGTISLNAGSFNTYNWSTGDTTSIIGIEQNSISNNQFIYLKVTDTNNCVATDSVYLELRNSINTNSYSDSPSIRMFPNPASDFITVRTKNTSDETRLEIFNAKGQQLKMITSFREDMLIDVSNFKTGFYIVKFYNEEYTVTEKLYVNH